MVICQIITSLVYGGAERLLVNFTNELVNEGDEVFVIYLKGEPRLKDFLHPNIVVHHIPLGFNCAARIRSLLLELKPDVVHTHLGHADLVGLWACRGLSVKKFCTMHNVYFKWNWIDNVIFVLYYLTFKYWGRDVKVSCISNAVAAHVVSTLKVPEYRVGVDHNCIPEIKSRRDKQTARTSLGLSADEFCIVMIGRLRVQKSVETMLHASHRLVERIPNLKLLIVGEGEDDMKLKKLADQLGLDDTVRFEGGTKDPDLYFAACDVFALTSVFEGLPTVVLEAFRSAAPVVASRIDGVTELITDGTEGLLFDKQDEEGLANCVIRLHDSAELRRKLGENGQRRFLADHTIDVYARRMKELYSR